jgi:type IV secretory pathway VirB10-like protein
MTTAPKLIRALVVAAVCIAAFAVWSPAAFGQEAPPATGDVIGEAGTTPDPQTPPQEPAPEPPVTPTDTAPEPPPPPPPPDPDPVQEVPSAPDTLPVEQVIDRPSAQHEDSWTRPEAGRESAPAATPVALAPGPSDVLPPAAELPTAGAGEDFAWTDKGDAFIFETGGSSGGNATAVLASLSRFGSIAAAGVQVPALGARERAAREAAQANASGSGLVLVDNSGSAMLFFNLFGGGGGGGAALVLLTVVGLLAVFRLIPPDWTRAFRNSTAVWRPSAYAPPIERPG